MGVSGDFSEEGQWAISSGTGEFALAHGLIKHKPIPSTLAGEVRELHIHAFYTPMNNSVVSLVLWISVQYKYTVFKFSSMKTCVTCIPTELILQSYFVMLHICRFLVPPMGSPGLSGLERA